MQRSLRNLDQKSDVDPNKLTHGDALRRPIVDTLRASDEQPKFVAVCHAIGLSISDPNCSTIPATIFGAFAYANRSS
jgi:hypothetical protein